MPVHFRLTFLILLLPQVGHFVMLSMDLSGERQTAPGLGNWTTELLCRFDPLLDDSLDMRQCFLVRGAIRSTAC